MTDKTVNIDRRKTSKKIGGIENRKTTATENKVSNVPARSNNPDTRWPP